MSPPSPSGQVSRAEGPHVRCPQDGSRQCGEVPCLQTPSGQVRKAGWALCLQVRSSTAHLTEPAGSAQVGTAVVPWAQIHKGWVLVRTIPCRFPLARDTEVPTCVPTNTLMPSLRSGCILQLLSGILGCVSSVNVAALGPGVSQDPQDSPGQDHQGVVSEGRVTPQLRSGEDAGRNSWGGWPGGPTAACQHCLPLCPRGQLGCGGSLPAPVSTQFFLCPRGPGLPLTGALCCVVCEECSVSAANSTSSDTAQDSGRSGPRLEHRGRGSPGLRDGPGYLKAPSVSLLPEGLAAAVSGPQTGPAGRAQTHSPCSLQRGFIWDRLVIS